MNFKSKRKTLSKRRYFGSLCYTAAHISVKTGALMGSSITVIESLYINT